MKKKTYVGIMLTMFLVTMLFNGIPTPVKAAWAGTIRVGAIGPMPWIQGQGIREGCELAAKQINLGPNGVDDGGSGDDGIVIGGSNYKVAIKSADTLRGMPDPTGTTGAAAASELVAAPSCDFVIGGFRTEATYGIRETLMDYKKIYFIAGAATNELVWDPTKPDNIFTDYARYKYVFRNTPINSTQLFYAILGYVATMMPRLIGMFGYPLPISVCSEALTWADTIHSLLMYYLPFYGGAIVHNARISPVTTDVTAELTGIKASGARLVVEVISGPAGRTFAKQFADLGVKAYLAGIDVPGQEIPLHWTATGGKCEYESFLVTCGQETPIFPRTLAYYQAYMAEYGHAPIYTSYGAYDAILGIERTLEANAGSWPVDSDTMVPWFEATNLDGTGTLWDYCLAQNVPNTGIVGKFKYTGVNGVRHDVWSGTVTAFGPDSRGPFWINQWVRALWAQWQYTPAYGTGRLQLIFPLDKAYSTKTKISPAAYLRPEVDLSPGGGIGLADMGVIAQTWQSFPGHPNWIAGGAFLGLLSDMDYDKIITILDASVVAAEFGQASGPL